MKRLNVVKRVLDIALTITLLLLMSFQVTKQFAHEWLGVAMLVLTILHQILNRRFYTALFKGKYTPVRVLQLVVNVLLLLSFFCTAASGMMMSRYAAPFLNGIVKASFTRQVHVALSHWSFVLMGLHLGLHLGIVASSLKNRSAKIAVGIVMCAISVYGFCLFFTSKYLDYMTLRVPFAFLDYAKPWWLVILENMVMLLAWAFTAYLISLCLRKRNK